MKRQSDMHVCVWYEILRACVYACIVYIGKATSLGS